MIGTFDSTFTTEMDLKLLALNNTVEIVIKRHLIYSLLNYNLILGRDVLHELGIISNFEDKTINW